MKKFNQASYKSVPSTQFNKHDSAEKKNYGYYLFTLAVLLTVLPFFFISLYNHPSADDFCFAVKANSLGFWETQLDYYNNWTGRYMATALLTVRPTDYNALADYKLLPIFLFVLFGASVFIFISKLLPNATLKDRGLLSFVIFFLYIFKTPNMSEAFYWLPASITYQLALISTLLLFSVILHLQEQKGKSKIYYTILGSLLCIVTVGFNEISMMLLLIILFLWLLFSSYRKKKLDWSLLILLLVTIVASGVVVIAPGNAARMSVKADKFQLGFSINQSIKLATTFILLRWLPIAGLLFLLFIELFNRIGGYIRLRYQLPEFSLFHISLLAGFLFGVIYLSIFPAYWSQGGAPPSRAINVSYLVFIFGGLALFLMCLLFLQNNGFRLPRLSFSFKMVLGLLFLVVLLFKSNNVKTVYKDLLKGTARQYHLEMQDRYTQLSSCPSDSCSVPPLSYIPGTIYAFDLVPDPSYEVYYYNECISAYFDKVYVSAPLE